MIDNEIFTRLLLITARIETDVKGFKDFLCFEPEKGDIHEIRI